MLLLLALLACGDAPPAPVPEQPPPEAPAEPEPEAPVGRIGGEPILPKPTVLGGISSDDVNTAIAARMEDINRCYTAQREKNPELAGKVLVKFVISKNGIVRDATTKSTSLRDETTEKCVNEQVAMAKFPTLQKGDMAVVHYPFEFPQPTN